MTRTNGNRLAALRSARNSAATVNALARILQEGPPLEVAAAPMPVSQRDAIFAGAEVNRLFMDWMSSVRTADEEVRRGGRPLRGRARDLSRNDGYSKKFLLLLAANVIGPTGPKLQSQVKDEAGELWKDVNDTIEAAWRDYWEGPVTVDGRLRGVQLEQLGLKTVATDGELFVRMYDGWEENRHGLALQPIDADMLDESFNRPQSRVANEIRLGVEVNPMGRPLAYWFNRKPTGSGGGGAREPVTAEDVLHLYVPNRLNQTRGLTWFHSIMAPLKMLNGYEEAEVVAARAAAAKMGWIQAKDNALTDLGGKLEDKVEMDAAPGTVEQLPAGWEFVGWNPDHPVAAYAAFVKGVLRKIATGLGVSYNVLADDLEGVNYSSMRSGLLVERDLWRLLQVWWIQDFRSRVFERWLSNSLLTGTLQLPSLDFRRWLAARWTARGWAWVDPLKEVKAATEAIAAGLGSRTKALAEQGLDFEEILEDLKRETALAGDAEVEIGGTGSGITFQPTD